MGVRTQRVLPTPLQESEMSQQASSARLQPLGQSPATPASPVAPSCPMPIHPDLLRHIGGGNAETLPNRTW